jgi:Ca2+-transporting ATPase
MILSETSQPWHTLTAEAVAEKLDTDLNGGLSPSEAQQRQQKYGRNELRAKPRKSPVIRFLGEFQQPLIYILLLAALIALLLKDWVDAVVIFAVTFINALIGWGC